MPSSPEPGSPPTPPARTGRGVVLVTGAGSGLRAEMARQFAARGSDGALAQCEAALEVLRRRQRGHLVLVSSVSALRGMPRSTTTDAATTAGVAALAEGLRAMVEAIEARRTRAYVPARPWVPIGVAMPVLPLSVARRLT